MKVVIFCHSLISCWNHGNAHFLRGIVRALKAAGHAPVVLEPADGWSRANLLKAAGAPALAELHRALPDLEPILYERRRLDLDAVLDKADLVLVHEWNEPGLVRALGARRKAGGRFTLLFHDTHHRAATRPEEIGRFDLDGYDGVLAFGEVIRKIYERRGWARASWVWHEAADTSLFYPCPGHEIAGDLVWIGNWGDDERTAELETYLIGPASRLGLNSRIYGVRYPEPALARLREANIAYGGWLPNHRVAETFARFRVTVHVPRRPYARALPGIPTIRVFEALASGIPLVSAPWEDTEGLFPEGCFLMAADGSAMARQIKAALEDADLRASLIAKGLKAIRSRHSCAHRVAELLAIHAHLEGSLEPTSRPESVSKQVRGAA